MENPTDSTEPSPASTAPRGGGKRHAPIFFGVMLVVAVVLSLLSFTGVTAVLLPTLGFWPSAVLALIPAIALPTFLIVRASAALKRKPKIGNRLRHVISIVLYLVIHAAILGVVFDWAGRKSSDVATAASALIDNTVGNVPWLSGMLKKQADNTPNTVIPDTQSDAGPAVSDAGVTNSSDAGPLGADAGTPAVEPSAAFSPRVQKGGVVRRTSVVVKTEDDTSSLALVSVRSQGGTQVELLSLAAFKDAGPVTALSEANDGSVAVVMAGAKVLVRGPRERLAELRQVRRGATLSVGEIQYEVRQIRDVVVSRAARTMMVVDLFVTKGPDKGQVKSAWLANVGKGVLPVRIAGQSIAGEADSVAQDFSLRPVSNNGAFVVVETFLEGGVDVPFDASKERFQTNPQRLLSGQVDNPEAFVELARTDAAAGFGDKSVQLFFDAFTLADGRVIFDANFVENGKKGWVFEGTRKGTRALNSGGFAADKPFSSRAQSAPSLDVENLGAFVFVTESKVSKGDLRELENVKTHSIKNAFDAQGRSFGVSNVRRVEIAEEGDWVFLHAEVITKSGKSQALLLSSKADLQNSVAEIVMMENAPSDNTAKVVKGTPAITRLRSLPPRVAPPPGAH